RDRHRGFQLPADAGQDRPLQRVRPREGAPRRARPAAPRHTFVRVPGTGTATPDAGSPRRQAGNCWPFRSIVEDYEHADVLPVVVARAARSARLTTHFDLAFPRAPQTAPYW